MTTDKAPTGVYLSDDAETRMRLASPPPCRECRHLLIRRSFILDHDLKLCEAAGDNEILGRILLRLAESGRCDEASPLFELESAQSDPQPVAGDAPGSSPVPSTAAQPAQASPPTEDEPEASPATPLSTAIELFFSGIPGGGRR